MKADVEAEVRYAQRRIKSICGPGTLTTKGIASVLGCSEVVAWQALENLVKEGTVDRTDKGWRVLQHSSGSEEQEHK